MADLISSSIGTTLLGGMRLPLSVKSHDDNVFYELGAPAPTPNSQPGRPGYPF